MYDLHVNFAALLTAKILSVNSFFEQHTHRIELHVEISHLKFS